MFHCPHCGNALSESTMKAISHTYFPKRSCCDSCNYTVSWLQWPQRFLAFGLPIGILTPILAIATSPHTTGPGQRPGFLLTLLIYAPLLIALLCLFVRVRYGRLTAVPNGHKYDEG